MMESEINFIFLSLKTVTMNLFASPPGLGLQFDLIAAGFQGNPCIMDGIG